MREGPSEAQLASAVSWGCRVSSWLGSTLLAADVPVISGRVSASSRSKVPEVLELTVPPSSVESGRTVDWLPRDPGAAVARYGQILDVTVTVGGFDVRIGRYLITSWVEQANGSVRVTGAGLLQQAADDRLTAATGPRDDGTMKSEFLRLLPAYMTAAFDPTLVDRPVPRTMEWDENRLENLYEIADAWPARIRTDPWGQVVVSPPLPVIADPVLTLTDGQETTRALITPGLYPGDDLFPGDDVFPGSATVTRGRSGAVGTVISAPTSDSRDSSYNVFVARSSANGVEAQAVAKVLSGPMNPDGPYRPVPKFFASPLLLTEAQCLAAAQTMRDESVHTSRVRKVSLAPDPRPELDDPVELILRAGRSEVRERGYVIGYDLPLTVRDGESRLDIATF